MNRLHQIALAVVVAILLAIGIHDGLAYSQGRVSWQGKDSAVLIERAEVDGHGDLALRVRILVPAKWQPLTLLAWKYFAHLLPEPPPEEPAFSPLPPPSPDGFPLPLPTPEESNRPQ